MTASATGADRRTSSLKSTGPIAILVLLAAAYLPLRLMMESSTISESLYRVFYIYGIALQPVFAAVIIAVAVSIGVKQSVGRQWLLLGLGVAMYAVGDLIWMTFELFLKVDPYPSVADIFYTAEYAFFLAAIVLAIRAYSGLVKTRKATIVGGVVAVVATGVLYVLLLGPYIFPAGVAELGFWGLVVSTLYPIGDVVFMLAPAVSLAMVVAQLGAGKLARPWWVVVAGAVVFAFADAFYAFADWAGTGLTPAMDMGWIVANLLFAVAALVALDVYRVR